MCFWGFEKRSATQELECSIFAEDLPAKKWEVWTRMSSYFPLRSFAMPLSVYSDTTKKKIFTSNQSTSSRPGSRPIIWAIRRCLVVSFGTVAHERTAICCGGDKDQCINVIVPVEMERHWIPAGPEVARHIQRGHRIMTQGPTVPINLWYDLQRANVRFLVDSNQAW